MVNASGTNKYTYTAAGQLLTEDGPWASDTVTNEYSNRLRTKLSVQPPSGVWTNGFAYDGAKRLTNVSFRGGNIGYTFLNSASHLTKPLTWPRFVFRHLSLCRGWDGVNRLSEIIFEVRKTK